MTMVVENWTYRRKDEFWGVFAGIPSFDLIRSNVEDDGIDLICTSKDDQSEMCSKNRCDRG